MKWRVKKIINDEIKKKVNIIEIILIFCCINNSITQNVNHVGEKKQDTEKTVNITLQIHVLLNIWGSRSGVGQKEE